MLDTNFISEEHKKKFEEDDHYKDIRRTGEVSGERLARLAIGEIEGGATAAFFSDEGSHPSSVFSRSASAISSSQKELWAHSISWSGVTDEEMKDAGF